MATAPAPPPAPVAPAPAAQGTGSVNVEPSGTATIGGGSTAPAAATGTESVGAEGVPEPPILTSFGPIASRVRRSVYWPEVAKPTCSERLVTLAEQLGSGGFERLGDPGEDPAAFAMQRNGLVFYLYMFSPVSLGENGGWPTTGEAVFSIYPSLERAKAASVARRHWSNSREPVYETGAVYRYAVSADDMKYLLATPVDAQGQSLEPVAQAAREAAARRTTGRVDAEQLPECADGCQRRIATWDPVNIGEFGVVLCRKIYNSLRPDAISVLERGRWLPFVRYSSVRDLKIPGESNPTDFQQAVAYHLFIGRELADIDNRRRLVAVDGDDIPVTGGVARSTDPAYPGLSPAERSALLDLLAIRPTEAARSVIRGMPRISGPPAQGSVSRPASWDNKGTRDLGPQWSLPRGSVQGTPDVAVGSVPASLRAEEPQAQSIQQILLTGPLRTLLGPDRILLSLPRNSALLNTPGGQVIEVPTPTTPQRSQTASRDLPLAFVDDNWRPAPSVSATTSSGSYSPRVAGSLASLTI